MWGGIEVVAAAAAIMEREPQRRAESASARQRASDRYRKIIAILRIAIPLEVGDTLHGMKAHDDTALRSH